MLFCSYTRVLFMLKGVPGLKSLNINFTWKGLKFCFCINDLNFCPSKVSGLCWQVFLRKRTSLSLVKYITADILLQILQIVCQNTMHPFWVWRQILCPVHNSIYNNLTQWVVDNMRNITLMVEAPISFFDGFGSSGLYYEITVLRIWKEWKGNQALETNDMECV